jgi:hypothetical protein
MLKVATDSGSAVFPDVSAANPGSAEPPQVVEVGLLMPAHWASALIELSKIRQTSVAQILRASVAQTLREVGVPV